MELARCRVPRQRRPLRRLKFPSSPRYCEKAAATLHIEMTIWSPKGLRLSEHVASNHLKLRQSRFLRKDFEAEALQSNQRGSVLHRKYARKRGGWGLLQKAPERPDDRLTLTDINGRAAKRLDVALSEQRRTSAACLER